MEDEAPKKKKTTKRFAKKAKKVPKKEETSVERVMRAEAQEIEASKAAKIEAPVKETEPESAALNIRVSAVPSDEGTAVIRPLKDLKRVRIGKTWYSFQRGKPCRVPRDIVPHLREKAIV